MRDIESDNLGSILIVDDRWEEVFLLQRLLRVTQTPRPICTAGGGEDAIQYLTSSAAQTSRRPSLILLDVDMPNVSGFDVLSWVREQPVFRKVVVIMLAGSADESDIQKSQELGAQGFLLKYPSSQTLAEVLDTLETPDCQQRKFPGLLSPPSFDPNIRLSWQPFPPPQGI